MDDKKGEKQVQEEFFEYKVAITHKNVKEIERFCDGVKNNIKTTNELAAKEGNRQPIKARGAVRIPTKHLRITVRKSPCGNGSPILS